MPGKCSIDSAQKHL